jgi:diguanylate cyclase (GGDEF)-like protein/PAS domain S-box-containing protein
MSSANAGEAPPPADARTPAALRPADSGLFAPLRNALLDSRQRWRDLVDMTADFAFETDGQGRFSFVMPDPALGWSAVTLLGQPANRLLAEVTASGSFNPFQTTRPIRRHRTWLKRPDGVLACIAFAAAPLLDAKGRQIGVRGLGIDVTEQDDAEGQMAAMRRRSEVLDHILTVMRHEMATPDVMRAALDALANALGAEGAAVISAGEAGAPPTISHQSSTHQSGTGQTGTGQAGTGQAGTSHAGMYPAGTRQAGEAIGRVLATAARLLDAGPDSLAEGATDDGRAVLVCACQTRVGATAGLALWRPRGALAWDLDDRLLVGAATLVVRIVLEQDAMTRDIGQQARTDALTGLFNRRAFLEELPRHLDRLDREDECGTLMFVDLDNFKPVNDQLGHEIGDQVLGHAARMLRDLVRPTDLVARFGGDEFAIWMNGADHMTAAERAENLRVNAPRILAEIAPGLELPLSMSIGIASRPAGSNESIESVLRRADMAMYAVKRAGRGHWRVSHAEPS